MFKRGRIVNHGLFFAYFLAQLVVACNNQKPKDSDSKITQYDGELAGIWNAGSGDVPVALTLTASETDALKILEENCFRCHGAAGVASGGVGNITDTATLISQRFIIPGKPEESRIAIRLKDTAAPMPPLPAPGLAVNQIQIVEDFIRELATVTGTPTPTPDPNASPTPTPSPGTSPTPTPLPGVSPTPTPTPLSRPFIDLGDEFGLVTDDLQAFARANRNDARFARYFSLVHLYNAGQSDAKLAEHANSLSRFVNSLSTRRDIALPEPINAEKTIFRIDLRDYGWSEQDWNDVTRDYHYEELVPDPRIPRLFQQITGEENILIRADWFTYHAAQPEFYHDLLDIEDTLDRVERVFNFDLRDNINRQAQGRSRDLVMRSGFKVSGVSLSNRVMERHDLRFGAFWISYDFAKVSLSTDDQFVRDINVLASPLGPSFGSNNFINNSDEFAFDHDAGEVIASLPNGLHWYMLLNNQGVRQDVAPTNIVADVQRPEGVTNGYSCFNCHANGLLRKDDEVRGNINNLVGISNQQRALIQNLYPAPAQLTSTMDLDNQRYRSAIQAASFDPNLPSPSVLSLGYNYEAFVTPTIAAAELGFSLQEFLDLVDRRVSNSTQNQLSPLLTGNGIMSRTLYEPLVERIIDEIIRGGNRNNNNNNNNNDRNNNDRNNNDRNNNQNNNDRDNNDRDRQR